MTDERFEFNAPALTAYREAAGYSREQLAVAVGRSYQAIASYELGRGHPGTEIVLRLAAELGCHPGDLFRPVDQVPA